MSILVCYDDLKQSAETASMIRDAGQPEPGPLVGQDLTRELEELFRSVKACFDDPTTFTSLPRLSFNEADIVILDNNLAHLEVTGARLTAESIAGYIRAFTGASYIISLNKNPEVDFDLRYLVGDYSTRADLALNMEHLSNPALWTGDPGSATNGFLPWYWPRLETAHSRRRNQYEFVLEHLDDFVLPTLGFDDEAISLLSPHALGSLSPNAESDGVHEKGLPPREIRFRDVFKARGRSLPVQAEREKLSKAEAGNGVIREIIARVVAADIDLWFRRDVVGPQEPLVDVPHLLMRMPFLLGGRAKDINEWNRCIGIDAIPYGVEQKLYDDHLGKTKFEHDIWVPHASFWWHKLKTDESLNELFFAAKDGDWADAVFCEDRSAFLERSPQNGEVAPIEFPAEFEGSWVRRYVARMDKIQYAPRSRFAT